MILYAKWNVVYEIVFNLNGGDGAPGGIYTVKDVFVLPVPVKTGYTFLGWYDNSELTGNAVTEIPHGSTGNKAFWAKWEATVYSITYHLNGGTGATNGTYTIESNAITLPADPVKTGYTFGGWYDNAELAGTAVTEIPEGSTGNKTFYAKWNPVTYTITFDLNGGTGVANSTYTIESPTVVLPIPTYTNYNFLGWYDNSRFTGNPITEIPIGSTGNKTFYAKWEAVDGIDAVNVSGLSIYPNPVVNGLLTVDNIQSVKGQIEIYSIIGTLVKVYAITGATTRVDVSALPAGTYLVNADGKKAVMLKK